MSTGVAHATDMALTPARFRLLLSAAAAATFAQLAQRPSTPAAAAAAAAIDRDPEKARGADAIATMPAAEPAAGSAACDDAIASAKSALGRPDAELGDDDVLHVCTAVQVAVLETPSCAARVHDVLAAATTCGRAFGAVASCVAPSPAYSPAWTRELLTHATPECRMRLVSSLHQAHVVDRELLLLVSRMAESETIVARRSRIWLALGTLARTARSGESSEARAAAMSIDAQIAGKLRGATGYARLYLLETAGNAACDGCVDEVRASLDAGDPALRRAAIAALRFRTDEPAVASMCAALDDEPSDVVREHAAWSLRWSAANEVPRTACLDRAARYDLSENVRRAAAQSLFALADRAPTAAAALSALTGASTPEEIAWLATSFAGDPQPFDPLGDVTGSTVQ